MTSGFAVQLAILPLAPCHEPELSEFFDYVKQSDAQKYFHPHPFSHDMAKSIVSYTGKDLYAAALGSGQVVGYGMLRGWDEGFLVPSLGLVLHEKARGTGLSLAFIHYLHAVAKLRGAERVRLTVIKDNIAACSLYRKVGYHLTEHSQTSYLGEFTL
jgi:ribosomal-protein-alanine N-acetyltransferase